MKMYENIMNMIVTLFPLEEGQSLHILIFLGRRGKGYWFKSTIVNAISAVVAKVGII